MNPDICITTASDLGRLVREKRKELRLTQVELAGMCNVGTRFVSDLENGKPTVEFDKAVNLARDLGIDLVYRER